MAHDRQLPPSDRDQDDGQIPIAPLPERLRLILVPLTPRLSAALEALDGFNRALFIPSPVVRRRLQAAIDEVECAVREALKQARART